MMYLHHGVAYVGVYVPSGFPVEPSFQLSARFYLSQISLTELFSHFLFSYTFMIFFLFYVLI